MYNEPRKYFEYYPECSCEPCIVIMNFSIICSTCMKPWKIGEEVKRKISDIKFEYIPFVY